MKVRFPLIKLSRNEIPLLQGSDIFVCVCQQYMFEATFTITFINEWSYSIISVVPTMSCIFFYYYFAVA